MLSGSFGQKGDPGVYFVEGARKEWTCRYCGDSDRLFFVVYRASQKSKEQTQCLPCVMRQSTHGRTPLRSRYFPAALLKKLDDFVVMEKLRDANKKKEEGV